VSPQNYQNYWLIILIILCAHRIAEFLEFFINSNLYNNSVRVSELSEFLKIILKILIPSQISWKILQFCGPTEFLKIILIILCSNRIFCMELSMFMYPASHRNKQAVHKFVSLLRAERNKQLLNIFCALRVALIKQVVLKFFPAQSDLYFFYKEKI